MARLEEEERALQKKKSIKHKKNVYVKLHRHSKQPTANNSNSRQTIVRAKKNFFVLQRSKKFENGSNVNNKHSRLHERENFSNWKPNSVRTNVVGSWSLMKLSNVCRP